MIWFIIQLTANHFDWRMLSQVPGEKISAGRKKWGSKTINIGLIVYVWVVGLGVPGKKEPINMCVHINIYIYIYAC